MPLSPFSASAVSAWLLVLLCAVSGTYCLLRARRAERRARGAAGGEAVMGLGMAVMAVPVGTGSWGPPVLLAVFCAASVHALWLLRDGVHHAHHLVGSLAMAYMALTLGGGPEHGHVRAGLPSVTGALLVYYAGYVLLGGARLVTAGAGALPAAAGAGSAAGAGAGIRAAGGSGADTESGVDAESGVDDLARACRLAMGTGMLAMLLTM
ncbi:DUF5134 domain-containing protein [Streptomyces sp. NBC_01276]|uniref:DUF5134 domain-containing protein n=1 Tax=Streptomyces sp. NBC_01276 TaxID=2903808 RepID=UPI00352F803D